MDAKEGIATRRAAVAQNDVQARLDRFLADVGHDSITSSENHQLFPLVVLDMSRAGRAFGCRPRFYNCSHTLPF